MDKVELSTNPQSANTKVYRLWRNERRLQLIVSDETVGEYLEVLERLGIAASKIRRLQEKLKRRETVSYTKLGPHPTASRDPDDNIVLATAVAGRAKFLVTNDHDLLDIPASNLKRFKFAVVTPSKFLTTLEE